MDSTKNMEAHKVYPRTYLSRVVFSISFETLSYMCYPALIEFVKSNFGLDVTQDRLECIQPNNKPLRFNTQDKFIDWYISSDKVRVTVKQEVYHSFNITLIPLIKLVQSFLTEVDRKANEIVLEKINLLSVSLNTYDELGENAISIFSENVLRHWREKYYQKDANSLLYQSKISIDNDIDLDTISGFIAKEGLEEGQMSRYILDISARYTKDTDAGNVLSRSEQMNEQLYKLFLNSVTDLVIKSMEEE